jgi:hypothetical protein
MNNYRHDAIDRPGLCKKHCKSVINRKPPSRRPAVSSWFAPTRLPQFIPLLEGELASANGTLSVLFMRLLKCHYGLNRDPTRTRSPVGAALPPAGSIVT